MKDTRIYRGRKWMTDGKRECIKPSKNQPKSNTINQISRFYQLNMKCWLELQELLRLTLKMQIIWEGELHECSMWSEGNEANLDWDELRCHQRKL